MKKILLLCLLQLSFLDCFSQIDWNAESCLMIDWDSKCDWQFPYDEYHSWIRQEPQESHTRFRIYQPETKMVAYINFVPFDKKPLDLDITSKYNQVAALFDQEDEKMRLRGKPVIKRETKNDELNGSLAIRTYYVQKIKDKSTGKYHNVHCLSFYLMKDIGSYIVSVKCPDDSFVKYGMAYMKGILSGFSITDFIFDF